MMDEPWSGCLSDEMNNETIACVHILINADRCFTISNIFQKISNSYSHVSINHSSIWQILTECLKMHKVCE